MWTGEIQPGGGGLEELRWQGVHDMHEAANGKNDKTVLALGPIGRGSPSVFPGELGMGR